LTLPTTLISSLNRPEIQIRDQLKKLNSIYSKLTQEEAELSSSILRKKTNISKIAHIKLEKVDKENHLPAINGKKMDKEVFHHKRSISLHSSLNIKTKAYLTSQENTRVIPKETVFKDEKHNSLDEATQSEKLLKLLRKIHSTLQTPFKTEMTFIELLKVLEARFEQVFMENKTIKNCFPQLYNKLLREFQISQKKDPVVVQADLQTLQDNKRIKKTVEQLRYISQSKLLRAPMAKRNFSLKSISKIGGLLKEVFNDEEYFVE
jgi:hypothetical protein